MKSKRTQRGDARYEEQIEFARSQRAVSNEFAASLWQQLRNRQCLGQKFRREYPIPPYTVDFCCAELKLIVEVDGKYHLTSAGHTRDQRRDRFLNEQGYQVLRIPGYQVTKHPSKVLEIIRNAIQEVMLDRDESESNSSVSLDLRAGASHGSRFDPLTPNPSSYHTT